MTPTTRIRIIWIVLAILVILAGLAAASPYLINTRVVKKQISKQVSEWMGLPVRVRGEPVVTVFPFLTIKLKDVRVSSNLGPGNPPLIIMDTLKSEMYWLPLLLGNFEVRRFNLVRPTFHLHERADGQTSWDLEKGTLFSPQKTSEGGLHLSEIKLGRFNINGGKARYINDRTGRDESFDEIDLAIVWPSTDRAATVEGTVEWRDRPIAIQARSDKPMELFASGLSPMSLSVQSELFSASLEGSAATMQDLQLEGDVVLQTPSLKDLLVWLDYPFKPMQAMGPASIKARANMVGASVAFADMALTLDDNRADGVLQLDFRRERGLIQGTLAYDGLDLSPYLQQFGGGKGLYEAPLSPQDLGQMDIDIRLSANSLKLGRVQLGRTAASLVTRNQQLSFSIGEAFAYGGRLEASLDMRPAKNDPSCLVGHLRAKANGILAGTLSSELVGEPFVTGTAIAEIDIQGEGKSPKESFEKSSGSLSMVLTDGSFNRFNLTSMQDAFVTGEEIEPDALYEGGTRFDVLSILGALADNRIQIEGLRMTAGDLALLGSANVNLTDGMLDFPGTLAQYRSSDPSTHSTEAPRQQYPFHLAGHYLQPSLVELKEEEKKQGSEPEKVSVPGVPDIAPDMVTPASKPEMKPEASPETMGDQEQAPDSTTEKPDSGSKSPEMTSDDTDEPSKLSETQNGRPDGKGGQTNSSETTLPDALGDAARDALQLPEKGIGLPNPLALPDN